MRWLSLVLLVSLFPVIPTTASPVQAQSSQERCFPETERCLSGRFRQFWDQNGGLTVFGFPITAAAMEVNRDTGQSVMTQWFERNRFELHPQNQAPYDVLLGRLGDDRLLQSGRNWQNLPRVDGPQANCLHFPQTRHNVCDQAPGLGFKSYWQTHGLADPTLDAFGRSLALFGLPLSEPAMETNATGDRVLTQWFERARLEWHPDKPDQFKVLLGLLGNEVSNGGRPAPERNEVVVLDNDSAYTTRTGTTNRILIYGEVRNDTASVVEPKITARLFDDQGNRLRVLTLIPSRLTMVKPGQKAPMRVSFTNVPTGEFRYELQAEWINPTVTPLEGITVLSKNVIPYPGRPDGRYIVGVARNDSGVNTRVRFVVTQYNAQGKVVGSAYTSRTLNSGQQVNYRVGVLEWRDTTQWVLETLAVPPAMARALGEADEEEE